MKNNNGKFRKKKIYFTQISNCALRDKYLSFSAKGLYSLIQSYITIPDFDLYKSFLMEISEEGRTAFDRTWKELQELGYLKVYKMKDEDTGTFYYEYELLDESELNGDDRFNKAKEIKKNVYKTVNNGFKKKGTIVSVNGNSSGTQTVNVDKNVEKTPITQTIHMDKSIGTDCNSGDRDSIIILNNNTYSVVVEEHHKQEESIDKNINVTIVETRCKLKRKLTDTQKEFVSTCNTDKLLKSIEIANEINPESYTFGYIKEIYNNDKNFIEKKKAPVTRNNKDFNKSNIQNYNNIIDNFEPKYNHKNRFNAGSNNDAIFSFGSAEALEKHLFEVQSKKFNNRSIKHEFKKTSFHNFKESFTKYSPEELDLKIKESQRLKYGE